MSGNQLNHNGVVRALSSQDNFKRHVQFTVDRLIHGDFYFCYLGSSYLRVTADTYGKSTELGKFHNYEVLNFILALSPGLLLG